MEFWDAVDGCKLCDCRRLNLTLWKILNFQEYSIDYDEIVIGILLLCYNCQVDWFLEFLCDKYWSLILRFLKLKSWKKVFQASNWNYFIHTRKNLKLDCFPNKFRDISYQILKKTLINFFVDLPEFQLWCFISNPKALGLNVSCPIFNVR